MNQNSNIHEIVLNLLYGAGKRGRSSEAPEQSSKKQKEVQFVQFVDIYPGAKEIYMMPKWSMSDVHTISQVNRICYYDKEDNMDVKRVLFEDNP